MGKKANALIVAIIIVAALFIVMELSGPQEPQGYTITYPARHNDETFDLGALSHRDFSLSHKGQYQISVTANGAVDVEVYSRGQLADRRNDVRNTTLDFFNESEAVTVRIINDALLQGRTIRVIINKEYYEEWFPD